MYRDHFRFGPPQWMSAFSGKDKTSGFSAVGMSPLCVWDELHSSSAPMLSTDFVWTTPHTLARFCSIWGGVSKATFLGISLILCELRPPKICPHVACASFKLLCCGNRQGLLPQLVRTLRGYREGVAALQQVAKVSQGSRPSTAINNSKLVTGMATVTSLVRHQNSAKL